MCLANEVQFIENIQNITEFSTMAAHASTASALKMRASKSSWNSVQ